jgi:hypothetical protein
MKLILLMTLILLVPLLGELGEAQTKPQGQEVEYDWKSVWRPQEWELWRSIHEKCGTGGGLGAWRSSAAKVGIRQTRAEVTFANCAAAGMSRQAGSAAAARFVRQMSGEVYMGSFREMGEVDLATSVAPMWNDPNVEDFILVNGIPRIVYLWKNVAAIDITRDPLYNSLRRRFPEITMWPMHGFDEMRLLADGGQRFVFNFLLLNGCRACEIAGSAEIAFDFNRAGKFLGTNLLQLKTSEEEPSRRVTVRSFKEFVSAIAPNTSITLEAGDYVIDKSIASVNPYVVWTTDQSGRQQHGLTIRNVDGLFISGPSEKGTARFIQPDESQAVLIFENSSNISINHLVAGHSPLSTWCWAGVLTFYDSRDIHIGNAELYGSGLYGLTLDNVRNLEFGQSKIRDCSYKIAEIKGSDNITFSASEFTNNGSLDLIDVSKSSNIFFDRVNITKNRSTGEGRSLFRVESSKNVTLTNSIIRENGIALFEYAKGSVGYDGSNKIDFAQFTVSEPRNDVETERWRKFIRDQFALFNQVPKPKRDWKELLILQTWGKFDSYQELYLLGLNRRNLAVDALSSTDRFLKKGDLANTRKYAGQSTKYFIQSNELFKAAEQVFAGSVGMTAQTLNAIYRGSAEASRYGWTLACGPKCGEVADYVFLMTDYAVDYGIQGADEAQKNVLSKALTKALLGSSGLPTWIQKRTTHSIGGSGLYSVLESAIGSPEFQKALMKVLAESGAYRVQRLLDDHARKSIEASLEFLRHSANLAPGFANQQRLVEATPLRLTQDVADDRAPAWSPDGQTIAFVSNRIGKNDGFDLFSTTLDQPKERLLLQFAVTDQYGGRFGDPSWLRTGDLLLLESKQYWETMRFRLKEAADHGQLPVKRTPLDDNSPYLTRLLFVPGGEGAGSPIATADGSIMAWHALVSSAQTASNQKVYEVRVLSQVLGFNSRLGNSDSAGRVLFRTQPGGMIDGTKSLAFSPDGTRVCVAANLSGWYAGKRRDLFVIDLKTGNIQRLTTTGEQGQDNTSVAWSSQNVIVFASQANAEAPRDLYLIHGDGTGLKQLTRNEWDELEPSWSPQGDQLVFSSNKEGNYDLYLLRVDHDSDAIQAQENKQPLTNQDIVLMIKAELAENLIVLAIQSSPSQFDTSPKALIELKTNGATTRVLEAMLRAKAGSPR